jgi:hypothetical protein
VDVNNGLRARGVRRFVVEGQGPGEDCEGGREGNGRKGGGCSVRPKRQGHGGDRLKEGGVKGTEVSVL